uniref:Uncharacterized protein n=1 Tax=Plectus sambesii TaxID=2011161 RepID=A0A914VWH9_9BILA
MLSGEVLDSNEAAARPPSMRTSARGWSTAHEDEVRGRRLGPLFRPESIGLA